MASSPAARPTSDARSPAARRGDRRRGVRRLARAAGRRRERRGRRHRSTPSRWRCVALASLPLVARRAAPIAVVRAHRAREHRRWRPSRSPPAPRSAPRSRSTGWSPRSDESRARTRLMAALVAALLVAHVDRERTSRRTASLCAEILFGVLVWGGAWLAGDRTRLRRERMAELEERALRAEREAERERRLAAAEERTRIARDLHDSAGHAINVILVHAGLGRLRTESDPEAAREAFETIEEVARETVGEIDQMVRALREDGTVAEGVEPPPGLASLDGLIERHRAAGLDRHRRRARGHRRDSPGRRQRRLPHPPGGAHQRGPARRRQRKRGGRPRQRRARAHGREPGEPRPARRAPAAEGRGSSGCASAPTFSAGAWRRVSATGPTGCTRGSRS